MLKFLVVIPAYNEESTIKSVIDQIKNLYPRFDILVVDDASTDSTASVAVESGARVIRHPINLGDGAARQTGFIYALKNDYDFAVQLDGDGQHDPTSIKDLLEPVINGEADLALGSRFLGMSYKVDFLRLIGMKLYSLICSAVMRRKITDPTSGFRAMNKATIGLYNSDLYPQKYPDANVILLTHYSGLKVKEIPVRMNRNITGKSIHSGLKPLGYIYTMTLSILMMMLRKNILMKGKR
jgi:hypothetical protein